jgi:tetratricopeptide (TPR) repeat protein
MNPKINEIKELINKKQYLNAQKKATDLLKILDDKDEIISCYILLAESYSRDIKNIKALEELNKALSKFPYEKEILEGLYDLSIKLKRVNESEQILKDLLMTEPENISYILRLVRIYMSKENYTDALMELNILLSQGNYSPTINGLASFCYEKLNLYTEQLKQIKILQQMNSENFELYFKEAEISINMAEYDDGINILLNTFDTYQELKGVDKIWIEKLCYFTKFFCDFGLKGELIKRLSFIDFKKLDLKLKNELIKVLKENKLDIYFTSDNIKNYTGEEFLEHSIYYSNYFSKESKSLAKKNNISHLEPYIKFLANII